MGQILHGSARTTAAVPRAIQHSQESLNKLAKRYNINPKTVAKWKKPTHVDDAFMGPKQPHSTLLTPEQEAACIAFRKHTLLPLDDCLYALQGLTPYEFIIQCWQSQPERFKLNPSHHIVELNIRLLLCRTAFSC